MRGEGEPEVVSYVVKWFCRLKAKAKLTRVLMSSKFK